jgi:hypothetical protein
MRIFLKMLIIKGFAVNNVKNLLISVDKIVDTWWLYCYLRMRLFFL